MTRILIVWACWLGAVLLAAAARSAELPFPPELTRPAAITMADLAGRKTEGVSVVEVSDYVYLPRKAPRLHPRADRAEIRNPKYEIRNKLQIRRAE